MQEYTKNLLKIVLILRKCKKHMKKNKELKEHMNNWLEKTYGTEKKLMNLMQHDYSIVFDITTHYLEIKDDYK